MSAMDQLNKINDICFFVNDFKGSLKFFTEKFGFKVKRFQPDEANANYAEFDCRGTTITMWERSDVESKAISKLYTGTKGHHFMIAVKVDSLEAVNEIYETLISRGIVSVTPPTDYPFGSRACYVLDHEENIWEIFAWFKDNGPGLLNN